MYAYMYVRTYVCTCPSGVYGVNQPANKTLHTCLNWKNRLCTKKKPWITKMSAENNKQTCALKTKRKRGPELSKNIH